MLDSTEASVNSALQRARAALDAAPARPTARRCPDSPRRARRCVARFADAFERGDVDAVVALLTDDAWMTMPPEPHEYQGRPAIAAFLRDRGRLDAPGAASGSCRRAPTASPRSAYYLDDPQRRVGARRRAPRAHARGRRRSRAITRFGDTGVLP